MNEITDEEFIKRAAAHYVKRASLSEKLATKLAEAAHGEWADDGKEGSPEEAVDADIECWGD